MQDKVVAADGVPAEVVTPAAMADIFGLAAPVYALAGRPVVAYFAVGSPGFPAPGGYR